MKSIGGFWCEGRGRTSLEWKSHETNRIVSILSLFPNPFSIIMDVDLL